MVVRPRSVPMGLATAMALGPLSVGVMCKSFSSLILKEENVGTSDKVPEVEFIVAAEEESSELLDGTLTGAKSTNVESELNKELSVPLLCWLVGSFGAVCFDVLWEEGVDVSLLF